MNGILFTPDNLKATMELRKWQTRRLMKPQPVLENGVYRWNPRQNVDINLSDNPDLAVPFARYKLGETVYLKEGLHRDMKLGDTCYDDENMTPVFRNSNFGELVPWPWERVKQSPMFMPEWAARTFRRVTNVRPERLQDISEDDAIAEGIDVYAHGIRIRPTERYADLWDSINRKPGTRWADSPWVFAYTFEVSDARS